MLTLGNRDVGKGLGVSNFGGETEMEDVELEEGEAYSYHDTNMNNEYSDCIDPDVSLSYIDAKIQHVLGHFQKDFEGGVSAENLGTKFGGYGSFLENGELSPICDTPRLLPPSHLEDGSRNPVTSLSVPQMMKSRFAPVRSVSPSWKQAHAHGLVRQEGELPPLRAVEHINSNEREEIKSAKLSDPRMLKVRIKVGSDNLSTQKKAAIYSGLGLDVSPSTSVDCSPSESEETSLKPQYVLIESPMSILQIMTSPFIHENLLLSPLQDDLILLTFKETLSEQRMDISNAGPCCVLANGSVPLRDKKVLERKLSDLKNRNDDIADWKSDHGMTSHHGTDASFDKNMEIDTMDREEVVSKTMKLPVISSACRTANMTKFMSIEVGSHFLEDKILNIPQNEGTPESLSIEDLDLSGKPKGYPGKPLQGKKATVDSPPRKNGIYPGATDIESKTRSSSVEYPADIPSEVLDESLSYPELYNLALPSQKENLPSKGKEKLKGSRTDETLGADASRESLSGSSSATKSNKSVQLESSRPKSGGGDLKLKDSGKSRDRYKEFFGDLDGEEDNEDELLEVAPAGGLQDGSGKGLSTENLERAKEGSKKIIKSLKATVNAPLGQSFVLDDKSDLNATPIAPVAPAYMKEEVDDKCGKIGAAIAPAAPVFIEDWVCCDKCQKWRLLPPGKNPNDLPDKWLCSMLDWLPGMNRCSVSQEETTGAIMASLQVPFSDAQKSEHLNFGVIGADINAVLKPEVKHTNFGPPPSSYRGTKKSETKGMSFPNEDGPQFSDSEKKQVQSAKRRSQDDVPIPLRVVADFEKPINHDLLGEKHVHELKANENHSDRGDLRNPKPHKRQEADRDNLKSSKKVKNELRQHDNEDWRSDDSKTSRRRVVERSPGGVPTLAGKNPDLDEEGYLKMSKHDSAKKIQVSVKNMRGEGRVSSDRRSLDTGRSKEIDIAAKKRKSKDPQEARESLEGTTERHQGSNGILSQDNEHRKNKKSRILKYEGKDPGIRQDDSKIDKKESEQIDKLLGLGNQPSRWGKTRSPMPAAAASSSSKVCSSPKSKSSFREMKGSPAESVSSLPVRSSKRDKHNSVPKLPMEKEECQFVKIVSPRKCHDGDIIAPDNNFWTDRQEESATAHDGFLGSSLVPDPDEIGFSANAVAKVSHSLDARGQKGQKDSRESSKRDALVPTKTEDSDLCLNGRGVTNSHHASESLSQKSGKASSSRPRNGSQSSKHEGERDKPKHYFSKSKEVVSLREAGHREGKVELQENVHDDGRGKCSTGEFGGKHVRVSQSIVNGLENKDDDLDALHGQSAVSHMDNKMKEYSTKPQYSKADQSTERLQSLPSSLPGVVDSTGTNKVNEAEPLSSKFPGKSGVDSTGTNKVNEAEPLSSKFPGKSGGVDPRSKNRRQRHVVSNGNCARETDARSPIKRDALNVTANKAIKEGADLKHMADRVKDSGSNLNRTVLYFQAALKFLHGASLLESSKNDSSKHYDMAQSVQVYGSTAKLCEYCAHEYEKSKDMASAALAYKCMEVAYLKVVYSSTSTASRDRIELQTAFKINPAGESPSSSTSDLDNVNNSAAVEKSAPKGITSPYVPGSESVFAQSRNSLIRLFNFSQDVSCAMEASRRSRIAFSAASARTGDAQHTEGISCIRRTLDFNFQDVPGMLRLVRLASEAIGQ